jgi:hypothetical protein
MAKGKHNSKYPPCMKSKAGGKVSKEKPQSKK